MNLSEVVRSRKPGTAIGHFNFAEISVAKAAVAAAEELGVPVFLGTSEGERKFIGPRQAAAIVKSFQAEGLSVLLNADHTKSFDYIKEAVAAGYDAVLFDGSQLPLAENIARTKEVVAYVKSADPRITVEGEIGYIGSSSQVLEQVPKGIELTSVEDAVRFVKETGVDFLAPAVGNIHGMLAHAPEPRLDIERIKVIAKAVSVPLVLHGASGNTDADVRAAIEAGIAIVHINTEVRVAWRDALRQSLAGQPNEAAPYHLLEPAREAARAVILQKLKIFSIR